MNKKNSMKFLEKLYSREVRKTDAKIFSKVPNELKNIEIDVEKKIFNVNGVPFGDGCSGFNISCKADDGFKIEMDIDTVVNFASYDMAGRKTNEAKYVRSV